MNVLCNRINEDDESLFAGSNDEFFFCCCGLPKDRHNEIQRFILTSKYN